VAGTAAELLNRTPVAESLVLVVALVLGAVGVGLDLRMPGNPWLVRLRSRLLRVRLPAGFE